MLKNAIWLFVISVIVLLIFLPSYSELQDLRKKNADYVQQIEDLKQERIQLLEEKRLLEDDPIYLEKVAREKMGLIREGEVIYRITPVDNDK